MTFSWKQAVVLLATAAAVSGTTACSDTGGATSAKPAASSAAPAPKDALLASLAAYDKGVYAADLTMSDGTGQSKVDVPKKQIHLNLTSTISETSFTVEVLVLEPDSFYKINMGALAKTPGLELLAGKTWLRVDRSKIKDESLSIKGDDPDPMGLKSLMQSAQSVQRGTDGKFSGTLDLNKGGDSPLTDDDVVKALGSQAAAVPFTATVDAEGRLSELSIDVPAVGEKKAHQLKLKLSEYGAVTMPAKPTGKDVVDAPATLYELFGS